MTDETKISEAQALPYVYRWNRQGRKGEPCNVSARGAMNSCLVEFDDGFKMVTSRNAIRRAALTAAARVKADANPK